MVSLPGVVAAQSFSVAEEVATLYTVHGIPGMSGAADDGMPVDVVLDDEICLAQDVRFGEIAGPFQVAPGDHKVLFKLPGEQEACTGKLVAWTALSLRATENVSAVAYLTEKGEPVATSFVNFPVDGIDFSGAKQQLQPYLAIRNVSAASPLNVVATEQKKDGAKTVFEGVTTGESILRYVTASPWQLAFYAESPFSDTFGYGELLTRVWQSMELNAAYFAYAIGSDDDGSFRVIVQALPIPR
jgi:hypothetical protein